MRKRILVIDDDKSIARAVMIRLKAAGYDTTHAPDGLSGLATAKEYEPDLILLDIRMPDLDGFEVNKRLKATPGLADIPVIIVSAHVQETARDAARAGGVFGFVEKPYNAQRLLETIEAALHVLPKNT